MRYLLLVPLLFSAPAVFAHEGGAVPADAWTHWNTNPLMLAAIMLPAYLYVRGAATYRVDSGRTALFFGGIAALFVALISPLDAVSGSLFSGHMVQHLVLILVAAPLLALSEPGAPILRGLPRNWRKPIGQFLVSAPVKTRWQQLCQPLPAFALHLAALIFWHIPAFYSAGVASPIIHALEHASFFLTALLYWWVVFRSGDYPMRVLAIFGVMMGSGLLGALMTFAQSVWYGDHLPYTAAWGLTPLQDQQIAGLLMWVPAGGLYVTALLGVLGAWLAALDQRTRLPEIRDA